MRCARQRAARGLSRSSYPARGDRGARRTRDPRHCRSRALELPLRFRDPDEPQAGVAEQPLQHELHAQRREALDPLEVPVAAHQREERRNIARGCWADVHLERHLRALPLRSKGPFSRSRYPKEGLRASSMAQAPLRPCWLTPRRPVPRIAGLCRAGLIDMLAPKTATYEYRAAPRRRPGVSRRSLRAQVTLALGR